MLTLESVHHHYLPDSPVLLDVDLTVNTGDVIALVGPSGSGKSTLLGIAGLVLAPVRGVVRHHGREVTDHDANDVLGVEVTWLFQSNNVFGDRTVIDNVALGLMAGGTRWTRALATARDALETVGLSRQVNQPVTTLSGGQAQRVAVARVLAQSPDLLLCDEPTAQLDRDNAAAVFEALGKMRDTATTVVIATHDHGVSTIADRVMAIEAGRLIEQRA